MYPLRTLFCNQAQLLLFYTAFFYQCMDNTLIKIMRMGWTIIHYISNAIRFPQASLLLYSQLWYCGNFLCDRIPFYNFVADDHRSIIGVSCCQPQWLHGGSLDRFVRLPSPPKRIEQNGARIWCSKWDPLRVPPLLLRHVVPINDGICWKCQGRGARDPRPDVTNLVS